MFLQPQHFQQQDGYHEARLRHYLHLLHPFCWGVKSLVVNESALRNFMFEIEQCELVTWDGALIRFQADPLPSNASIVPRPFEASLPAEGRPLAVYLGLKRLRWEENNVDARAGSRLDGVGAETYQRYSIQEIDTPDPFTADGQSCKLQYLMHEMRLFFGEDATVRSADYELLKIGELLRATEGQGAILSRRYIPPCLVMSASPVLEGMLKEVRDLLTAKGRELSEYKRRHHMRTVEMGSRDTVYLFMMQAVNRYIPLLHHSLEVRDLHPCTLYALLRQLVGELSTFSETVTVLGGPLPAYRHDQLWECFDAALRVTKELINGLAKGPEYVLPLPFDGTYFTTDLDKRFFEGNNRYYLSVNIDMPPREIEHHLTGTGKVCSREEMTALLGRALPGLMLRYVENPPEELPRRAHCSYFELSHHSTLWERIQQRQNIAVYCELPPQETEMQLLVIYGT
jgi:type VI secretion system protein ImpJ